MQTTEDIGSKGYSEVTSAYSTPFGITSQFAFCGLPLRLDTYRGCAFNCCFCFARYRGGNNGGTSVLPASAAAICTTIQRALSRGSGGQGVIAQFLRRRVPIHMGGMSDPFQPAEKRLGITRSVLETLRDFEYPTVISTRGSLVSEEPYLSLIRSMRAVVVQFSFSSTSEAVAGRLEPRSPSPSVLLRTMETLAKAGVHVTCRWQPYVPGVSESVCEFVSRVASAGCVHLGFEHLKVPLERNNVLWSELNDAAGYDLYGSYKSQHAKLDGRELLLPASVKLDKILEVAAQARAAGLTFGAADNEFQYLSDTACCCSGVDKFPGFENFFRYQIAYAVRKSLGKPISLGTLVNEWRPSGSVDRYFNSRSRLSGRVDAEGSATDHIRVKWNTPESPNSPASFWGVVATGQYDQAGRLYQWSEEILTSGLIPHWKANLSVDSQVTRI